MTEVIANIHFLNALLVLVLGTITWVWGFIVYFFVLKKPAVATAPSEGNEQAVQAVAQVPAAYRTWRIALIATAIDALLQALLGITLLLWLGQRPGTGSGDSTHPALRLRRDCGSGHPCCRHLRDQWQACAPRPAYFQYRRPSSWLLPECVA